MNTDSSIPEYVTAAIDHGKQLIVAWERVAADRTDLAALQAEAARLNAMPPKSPAAEPVEASIPPAPIDPLECIAIALENMTAVLVDSSGAYR